jgi:hypothetical protein
MASIEETVAAYVQAWNEPDTAARRKLLERAWAEAATYTDPTAHVEGREALVAHIGGFQTQMPGARLNGTSAVDEHHGRLARVVGFFGPPPAR